VGKGVVKTEYGEMDDAIRGRLDGIDAISLGAARCVSYISEKQRHLAGQRYTTRSMIDDMLWRSCGRERPEIVMEGFSQGGQDRWIVCTRREEDREVEVGVERQGTKEACSGEEEMMMDLLPPNRLKRGAVMRWDCTELPPPLKREYHTDADVKVPADKLCLLPPRRRSQIEPHRRTIGARHSPSKPQQCAGDEDEMCSINSSFPKTHDGSESNGSTMPHHIFLAQIWGKDNPPPPTHSLRIVGLDSVNRGEEGGKRGIGDGGNLSTMVSCPFDVDKDIYLFGTYDDLKNVHYAAASPLSEGRFDESMCIFRKIINSINARSKRVPGYILGAAYHNMGIVQMWAGRYEDSLENFLSAIEVRKRTLGPLHALVAVRF